MADPFLLHRDGVWHLFYEVFEAPTRRGVIGHAVRSDHHIRCSVPGAFWWNAAGVHHLDAQRLETGEWIAAVDGRCR